MLRWRDHHPTGKGSGKLRSAGQPAIGVALQIRRLDGTVADTAEIGENAVRSDAIMIDYLKSTKASYAAMLLLLGYWALCLIGNPADPYSLAGWFGTNIDKSILDIQKPHCFSEQWDFQI